jgi:hypothetical protein
MYLKSVIQVALMGTIIIMEFVNNVFKDVFNVMEVL